MYHQFMQLAGVDITKEAMEVGPTLHYIMGGVRVDPDSTQTTVAGLFAAGEVAAGLHGANRLGGNSLSDLLVFGRRAGLYAAEYAKRLPRMPMVDEEQASRLERDIVAPLERREGENAYTLHAELQDTMQDLVGIIRTKSELERALVQLDALKARAARTAVAGGRIYNPSWHLAIDLKTMLLISEAVTRSALMREESRGGHTREDFPKPDSAWAKKNIVTRGRGGRLELRTEPLPEVPPELAALLGEEKPTAPVAVPVEVGKS
jgi:succinate dehydrogenase / fumarate reductase flavoprotein subunit